MIEERHLKLICKLGAGEACCRYLGLRTSKWICFKLTENKDLIDQRVAAGQFNAKGDNCPGVHNGELRE